MRMEWRANPARVPLAAALWLAAAAAYGAAADPFAVDMPGRAGSGQGVAALMHGFRAVAATQRRPATPNGVAGVRTVTDCSDDGSPGTLRAVLDAAVSGDTIDMTALQCSAITLTQGALKSKPDSVTLVGPGADRLALVGNRSDRVIVHYGYQTLTLRDLTVRDGVDTVTGYHVAGGACILAGYRVALERATVSNCVSTGEGAYGGAILTYQVKLTQSTVSGNVAQGSLLKTETAAYGGGVFAYHGVVLMYDSTVSGNRVQSDPGNNYGRYDTGGGVFSDFGGLLYRSTVDNNTSDGTGGGVAMHGNLTVLDSTISGNHAGTRGGGVFVRTPYTVQFANSTVAFNRADAVGGGVYIRRTPQMTSFVSTLVANNAAPTGPDLAAGAPVAVSGTNDLIVAVDANVTLPPDTLHSDPRLLPLAPNGGPTLTHALAPGSPAIDRGSDAFALPTDQRGDGFPRQIGPAPDIGAYEAPLAPPVAVPASGAASASLLIIGLVCAAWRRRWGRT